MCENVCNALFSQPRTPLHIVADANIWGARQAFSALGHFDVRLDILEHSQINAQYLKNADILLVRSATKINKTLLGNASVGFVGTATVGDDHVDKPYLKAQNIGFASAAGSSTESVVEYMLACLFHLEQSQQLSLKQHTLGIIGVGRIGGLLHRACHKLGLKTLFNDPPRQRQEKVTGFHSLAYLLQHADILTLHTPLIQTGTDNTVHLLNAEHLAQFQGKGIINAGRGACLDNTALLSWLNDDETRFAMLDCWENEPDIDLVLLNHPQVLIATPHIAGHSLDGKAANTLFIYRALCDFLHIPATWNVDAALPATPDMPMHAQDSKTKLAHQLYPIAQDSQAMKQAAQQPDFVAWFRTYRRHYPVRRAWKKALQHNMPMQKDMFF